MRKRKEKPDAKLRIAFQTNRPVRPGDPRVYREIPGSRVIINVPNAEELETVFLPAFQKAINMVKQNLEELETELP